jgi:hypothetical protein
MQYWIDYSRNSNVNLTYLRGRWSGTYHIAEIELGVVASLSNHVTTVTSRWSPRFLRDILLVPQDKSLALVQTTWTSIKVNLWQFRMFSLNILVQLRTWCTAYMSRMWLMVSYRSYTLSGAEKDQVSFPGHIHCNHHSVSVLFIMIGQHSLHSTGGLEWRNVIPVRYKLNSYIWYSRKSSLVPVWRRVRMT